MNMTETNFFVQNGGILWQTHLELPFDWNIQLSTTNLLDTGFSDKTKYSIYLLISSKHEDIQQQSDKLPSGIGSAACNPLNL